MGELLNGIQIAARYGISKQAVSKAKAAGRIVPATHDDRGRPLYNANEVNRVFVVGYSQVDRVTNPGGRPARPLHGRPAPAPGNQTETRTCPLRPLKPCPAFPPALPWDIGPGFILPDGVSSDWFCDDDLETCFPCIGRAIGGEHLKPAGTFQSGCPAFSFTEAVNLLRTGCIFPTAKGHAPGLLATKKGRNPN